MMILTKIYAKLVRLTNSLHASAYTAGITKGFVWLSDTLYSLHIHRQTSVKGDIN